MKITNQILLACPALMLMLAVANPALASDGTTPTTSIEAETAQPRQLTPKTEKPNPIKEQMGCNCGSCSQARMQLQGKLPPIKEL